MPNKLSSAWTWFYKLFFGPIWILGFGLLTWLVVDDRLSSATPPEVRGMFVLGWLAGVAMVLWLVPPLKHVALRDGRLRVSNYLRSWDIPLGQIAEVRQNRWVKMRPIRVRLRQEVAGLGSSFTFMPPARVRIAFWREDPEVEELRALAAALPMPARRTAV